ncbi:hypothetical protein GCM10010401_10290 [Rarobacter faecitabidus]
MKYRKFGALIGSWALLGTLALVGTATATTATSSTPAVDTVVSQAKESAAEAAKSVSETKLQAIMRDLKLTKKQALARIKLEKKAVKQEKKLKKKLGNKFAGLWISKNGKKIVVGVTTKKAAKVAKKAGAKPKIVRKSLKSLAKQEKKFTRANAAKASGVSSWWIDPTTNKLVLQATSKKAANRALKTAGIATKDATVEINSSSYTAYRDYWGGDPLMGCTIAFAVEGGLLTAGHCIPAGSSNHGLDTKMNNTRIGTVQAYQYGGGIDAAYARNEGGWVGKGRVTHWNGGGGVDIKGSNEAPVGSHVCKSGMTTKWTCGYVTARNANTYVSGQLVVTVNTNVCSAPGDSGGALVWNDQAQGILSGGSGSGSNCSTVFQPINTILQKWNLRLTTTGNAGPSIASIQGWQNKCIDVPNSQFVNGAAVQIWDCNGTNAQRFEFHSDGTLRVGGKCLDLADWSTANGSRVQLWDCFGGANQQWTLNSSLDLVNKHANKCVDVKDWGRNNGAKLQIWECSGTANQKWWRK